MRRSGTRKMFRSRDSMERSASWEPEEWRLAVGESVPLGRRAPVPEGQGELLDPPAGGLDRAAGGGRERVRAHRERLGQLPAAEDLHQPTLGDQAPGAQHAGVDLGAGIEGLEGVEVHDDVLDPERVLEALGLRCSPGQRRLPAFEARLHVAAGALALHPPAGGLAALAADAARDPPASGLRARRGLQVVDLHVVSSTLTMWGTLSTIPRISGRSGCSTVWLMRRSPRARSVPRCLGFAPMVDRTWVIFNVAIGLLDVRDLDRR